MALARVIASVATAALFYEFIDSFTDRIRIYSAELIAAELIECLLFDNLRRSYVLFLHKGEWFPESLRIVRYKDDIILVITTNVEAEGWTLNLDLDIRSRRITLVFENNKSNSIISY